MKGMNVRDRSWRRFGQTSAGLAAVVVTTALAWPGRASTPGATAVVREAPFTQTLVERGAIEAARLMLYGSTLAGAQAKLLEMAPEGAAVAAGDVIIRFDPAPFALTVERETAAVAQADADRIRAREDLRLEQMRAETDLDAARDQVGYARRALVSERDGKGPLALAEAEAAANDAAREQARARKAAEDMQALFKQAFVTRVELDRAEQQLQQADDRRRLADLKLQTLRGFEQPATLDKSQAEVTAAEKGVTGAADAAQARLAQRQAVVAFAESRLADARLRLEHARDQLARTTVRAASGGLVVYRELYFGTEKRKPQPGDEVWPNQPLIAVPDSAQLVVQTRVREIDLHKVASSQRVRVTVDAYPGLELPATVSLIGALAQEDAARAGTKFFPVSIRLLGSDPGLRPGMTARVEIEVSSMPRAIVVPVEAIVNEAGQARCYVLTRSGKAVARPVQVADRNETLAAIASGLQPGETVLLIDPSVAARPGAR